MSSTSGLKTGLLTIGERLELLRRRRDLSRRALAELVGRSEEWLRLIESGNKPLDSVAIIVRLADALHIKDIRELIALPPQLAPAGVEAGNQLAESLKRSIIDYPAVETHRHTTMNTGSLSDLADQLHRCQNIWEHSPNRYTELAEYLPPVLTAARVQYLLSHDDEAGKILLRSYHLSRRFLTRVGAHQLAFTAADRATMVAEQTRDPWQMAACAWHTGNGMLGLAQAPECHDYAVAAAKHLADAADSVDKTVLIGALQLLAAKGAAAAGNTAEADRLTTAATRAANRFDREHAAYDVPLGPTESLIARLEVMLWGGDCERAAELAAQQHVPDAHPVGGRMRFHLAGAYACARRNDYAGASCALGKAADICPEDFRYGSDTQSTLHYLVEQDNRLVRPQVHELARVAGLR
ncbi:helix-turn-helix domain-containing protein [Nocardia sp. NPDC050175]|uniref:helix-turn-helix domain-containing protein n=1 Tax=Nocardia sp. NPDC050175 TaxID=3364317 RepID=UPI00378DADC2